MGEFFKSAGEFLDLLNKARQFKKKGALRIVVHGSIVPGERPPKIVNGERVIYSGKTFEAKGARHTDVDLYAEYEAEKAREIGCDGLREIGFMRLESGEQSDTKFDVRETNIPFENSDVGGYSKLNVPKRVIFGPKKPRTNWE